MSLPPRDTDPAVWARFEELLRARSAEDRVRMATSMFDAAKAVVRASLIAQGVTDPVELHVRMFRRIYGDTFEEATRLAIETRLRGHSPSG